MPSRAPLAWRAAYHAAAYAAALTALPVTALAAAFGRPWAVGLHERLGASPRGEGAPLWFHCASVGEQRAFAPLGAALRQARPELALVLSVTTPMGRAAATRLEPLLARPAFMIPADVWPLPGRALARLRPRLLALVETELWPNLLAEASRRGVPAILVNGRIEQRSFERYLRARRLFAAALSGLSLLAMRSTEDAERAVALGASAERVHVTGNMKFDEAARLAREAEPLPWAEAAGLDRGRWIVAGSTAAGEESLLLDAFEKLRPRFPDLRLALAPRRPERWDEVAAAVDRRGLPLQRRSRLVGPEEPGPRAAGAPVSARGGTRKPADETAVEAAVEAGGVLLLDSVGELARLYPFAELCFVGGSLVPRGGQNPLEAAAAGRPVLFGPHLFHFHDVEAALMAAGGAVRVDHQSLLPEIAALLADDDRRRELGAAAARAVMAGEGATQRTLELVLPLLDAGVPC